jgi:hypothetical protein
VTVKKNDFNKLYEEIRNRMAYIDKLKNTGNALSEMRMEEKECLQKDICNLRFDNQNIVENIRMLEPEFVDTDSEE